MDRPATKSSTGPLACLAPTARKGAAAPDVAVVLDAGALIAVDRRIQRVQALLLVAQRQGVPVRTSSAVVGQVWRDGARQANLARVLAGVEMAALDPPAGRRIGELLAGAETADVVDGHVALLAESGDIVLTSDATDLARLLEVRGIDASVEKP